MVGFGLAPAVFRGRWGGPEVQMLGLHQDAVVVPKEGLDHPIRLHYCQYAKHIALPVPASGDSRAKSTW
jgi:hypothetical protein